MAGSPRMSASAGTAATIAALSRPPQLSDYGISAAKAVMALRLVAICARSGHDPLAELSSRLGGVGPSKAMLSLIDRCGAAWPEKIAVHRPCCHILGPDESTIAAMAQAATEGNLHAFDAVLDGFIAPEKREGLFAETVSAMAAL